MLTFKKGKYTKEQLVALFDAMSFAQIELCKRSGIYSCDACVNKRPCEDIKNVLDYINTLVYTRRWTLGGSDNSN